MAREYKNLAPLTDEDIMPSGKYGPTGAEGPLKMIDVPAKYLLYIYENNMCNNRVKEYIIDNLDVIKQQAKDGL